MHYAYLIPTFHFFFLFRFCSHDKSTHAHMQSGANFAAGFMGIQQWVSIQVFCENLSHFVFRLKKTKQADTGFFNHWIITVCDWMFIPAIGAFDVLQFIGSAYMRIFISSLF